MSEETTETTAVEVTAEELQARVNSVLANGSERLATQLNQRVVNPIELARAMKVRPQMIYNYIRKGKIAAVRQNNTQKLFIEEHEPRAFLDRYYGRKLAAEKKVELELAGESA
jgi:hypothetical protein